MNLHPLVLTWRPMVPDRRRRRLAFLLGAFVELGRSAVAKAKSVLNRPLNFGDIRICAGLPDTRKAVVGGVLADAAIEVVEAWQLWQSEGRWQPVGWRQCGTADTLHAPHARSRIRCTSLYDTTERHKHYESV
jgi:hypothetical protein